jgi:hypothetical protein
LWPIDLGVYFCIHTLSYYDVIECILWTGITDVNMDHLDDFLFFLSTENYMLNPTKRKIMMLTDSLLHARSS